MEGSDKLDQNDCSGVGGSSRPVLASDSFDSFDLSKDANIINVDSF